MKRSRLHLVEANPFEEPACSESLVDHVNRAKARWLKRVMYETSANTTAKCFAYIVADHLNCVTLDSWPGLTRIVRELGCLSDRTPQRAALALERRQVLMVKRGRLIRYAPVFLPGDWDKPARVRRQDCPAGRDKNVDESLLGIQLIESTSTEGLSEPSETTYPAYNPRRRGAVEVQLAQRLGHDGMTILSRLAKFDDAIVERLCRAHAEGRLGDRDIHAARLAAEQM